MDKLAARIERVRIDLSAIQQELTTGAAWERRGAEPDPPVSAEVDLSALKELKSSVDEMRQVLWWLLQEIALGAGTDRDVSLHNFRLTRAAEMLRALRTDMIEAPRLRSGAETRGFIDALQSVAMVVVDRHMSDNHHKHAVESGNSEKK
ncbi:MAG: hypothetical protein ACE14M_14790 [Terriglobales bacterium]